MLSKRRWIVDILTLILVFTVITVMGIYVLLRSGIVTDRFNDSITAAVEGALKTDVSIGKVTGGFFSGLSLDDVVIHGGVDYPDTSVQRVQLYLNLRNLIMRRGSFQDNLKQVKLIGPKVTLLYREGEIYVGLFKLKGTSSGTLPKVPRLILRKGAIVFRDESDRSITLSDLNGDFRLDERAEARLKGRVGKEGLLALKGWADLSPGGSFALNLNVSGVQVDQYLNFIPPELTFKPSEGLLSLTLDVGRDGREGSQINYSGLLKFAQGIVSLEGLENTVKLQNAELRVEDGAHTSFIGHIYADLSYGNTSAKLSGDLKVEDAHLSSLQGSSQIDGIPFVGKASLQGTFSEDGFLSVRGETEPIDLGGLSDRFKLSQPMVGLALARLYLDGKPDEAHLRIEAQSDQLDLSGVGRATGAKIEVNLPSLNLRELLISENISAVASEYPLVEIALQSDSVEASGNRTVGAWAKLGVRGLDLRGLLGRDGRSDLSGPSPPSEDITAGLKNGLPLPQEASRGEMGLNSQEMGLEGSVGAWPQVQLAKASSIHIEAGSDELSSSGIQAIGLKGYLQAQGAEVVRDPGSGGGASWLFRLASSADGRLEAAKVKSGALPKEEATDVTSQFEFQGGKLTVKGLSFKLSDVPVESTGTVTLLEDVSSAYGYSLRGATFDLRSHTESIDLGAVAGRYGYDLQGRGRMNVRLYGSTDQPTLEARVRAEGIKIVGWDFPSLNGEITYLNGRASASLETLNGSLKGRLSHRKADGQDRVAAQLDMKGFEAGLLVGSVGSGSDYYKEDWLKEVIFNGSISAEGDLESVALFGGLSIEHDQDRLGSLRLNGLLHPSASSDEGDGVEVSFALRDVFLQKIPSLREKYPGLQGRASIEGKALGPLKSPRLEGRFQVNSVSLDKDKTIGDIAGSFGFDNDVLKVSSFSAFNNRVVGSLNLPLKGGGIGADVKIRSFELSDMAGAAGIGYPPRLKKPFTVDGDLRVRGRVESPYVTGSLTGLYGSGDMALPVEGRAEFSYYDGNLLLSRFTISQGEGLISGSGKLKLQGRSFTAEGIKIEKMDLKEALGSIEGGALHFNLPEPIIVDGSLDIWGDSAHVSLRGVIDSTYPINLGTEGIRLPVRLEGDLSYREETLSVSQLQLKTGSSLIKGYGRIMPGGDIDLSLQVVRAYAADILNPPPGRRTGAGNEMPLLDRLSPISGNIKVKGSIEAPVIEGELEGGYSSKKGQASVSIPDYLAKLSFNLHGREVSLEGFEIEGPVGRVAGNGRVVFGDGEGDKIAQLEVGGIALDGVKPLLKRYPHINGHLGLKGDVVRSREGWILIGQVSGSDVSLTEGEKIELNGKFALSPKSLYVSSFSVGRTISGQAEVDLTSGSNMEATIRVLRADLQEAIALSGAKTNFNLSGPLPLSGEVRVSGNPSQPVLNGRIEGSYNLPETSYNLLALRTKIPSSTVSGLLEFTYLKGLIEVTGWQIKSDRGTVGGRGHAQIKGENVSWVLSGALNDAHLSDSLSLASGIFYGWGSISRGEFVSARFELSDLSYRLNEARGRAYSSIELARQAEAMSFRISYTEKVGAQGSLPLRRASLIGTFDRSGLREFSSTADFHLGGMPYSVKAVMVGGQRLTAEIYQNYAGQTYQTTLFLQPSDEGYGEEGAHDGGLWSGRAIIGGLYLLNHRLSGDVDLKFEASQSGRLSGQVLTGLLAVDNYEVGPLDAHIFIGDGRAELDLKSYRGYSLDAEVNLTADPGWNITLGLDEVRISSIIGLEEFLSPQLKAQAGGKLLSSLMGKFGPRPFLNGYLTTLGKGKKLESLIGSLDLSLFEGGLDTLIVDFSLVGKNLNLNRAKIFLADGGEVSVSGKADLNEGGLSLAAGGGLLSTWNIDLGLDDVRMSSIVELEEFLSPQLEAQSSGKLFSSLRDKFGTRPFLNGHLIALGRGKEIESLGGSLDISLFEGGLDVLLADFSLAGRKLSLDSARVFLADKGEISASGMADLNGDELSLSVGLKSGSLSTLFEAVGRYLPTVGSTLDSSISQIEKSLGLGALADGWMDVKSSKDVLALKGNLSLSGLRPAMVAEGVGLDFEFRDSANGTKDKPRKIETSVKVAGLVPDINPLFIGFDGDMAEGRLSGRLFGAATAADGSEIGSLSSEIEYRWAGAQHATPLLLIKTLSALDGAVRASGQISPGPEGKMNLSLKGEVEGFQIGEVLNRIPKLSYLKDWLGGEVNGRFEVDGGASDVTLSGRVSYESGNIFGIHIDKMEAAYSFKNGLLTVRPTDAASPKRLWGRIDLSRPEADDAWSINFASQDTRLYDAEPLRRFYAYMRSGVPIEGKITGKLKNPSLKASFYSDGLNIGGEVSTSASGWISIEGSSLDFMLTDKGGSVVVEGRAYLDGMDPRSPEAFVPEVKTHFRLVEADAALLFNAIPLRVSASELGGKVSGDIFMEGPSNDQRGRGVLSLTEGRMGTLNAERIDAAFSFDSRQMRFDKLKVIRWGGEIIGDGAHIDFLTLGRASLSIDAHLRNLPMATLRATGRGRFDGLINSNPGYPLIRGQVWFPALDLNSLSFDGLGSTVEYHRDRRITFLPPRGEMFPVSGLQRGDEGYIVTGEFRFGGGVLGFNKFSVVHGDGVYIALDGQMSTISKSGMIRITSPSIEAEDVTKLLGITRDIKGLASLDIRLEGPLKSYYLSGGVTLENGQIEGLSLTHLAAKIGFDGKVLIIEEGDVLYRGTDRIALKGTIPVRDGGYQMTATVREADLSILRSIFSDVVWTSGIYKGELRVEGTKKGPQVSGRLVVEDGRFKTRSLFEQARDIKGQIVIENNVIRLGPMEGRMGDGTVGLAGQIDLKFGDGSGGGYRIGTSSYEIHAKSLGAAGVPLKIGDWLNGQAFAEDVWVKGTTPSEPIYIGGTGRLDNATIIPPPGGWGALRGSVSSESLLSRIVWDLEVTAGRNVWYKSFGDLVVIDLQARAEGSLRITGTRGGLVVSGQVNTSEGSFDYLDRVFKIEEGTLRLLTGTGASSILRAKGSTQVRYLSGGERKSDTVYANVDGTLGSVKVQLTSGSGLPEREIVSVLTLGSDYSSLPFFTEDVTERFQDSLFRVLEEQVHSVLITPVEETARDILKNSFNLDLNVLSFETSLTRKRAEESLTQPIALLDESRISAGIRISPNLSLDYEGILKNQASALELSRNKFSLEYKLQIYLIDKLIFSVSEEKGSVTEGSIGIERKF